MLDISLLGCGGMMPLPKRFLSALLIRHEGASVLIDCGEATQVALHLSPFSNKSIDHILITHFHGDHVSGLPGLLLSIGNSHRTEPLHIWGGEGLKRIVDGLTVICDRLPYKLILHELPFDKASSFQTGELLWNALPVKHRIPCLAYSAKLPRKGKFNAEKAKSLKIPVQYWSRLQAGESVETEVGSFEPGAVMGPPRRGLKVSFATDCRPSEALIELVRDSDLFVAEGLYGDPEKAKDAAEKGHMTFFEAAEMAKAAEVDELWLTHFSPAMIRPEEYLEATRAIFPETYLGHNLKTTTLLFKEALDS